MFDQGDVAQSAFLSFFVRARQSLFTKLDNRDHVWKLLAKITSCKAVDRVKSELRDRRNARRTRGLEIMRDGVPSPEPGPEEIAIRKEEIQCRMINLDDKQRQIAHLKSEGYTNEEIAELLGCSIAKLKLTFALIMKKLQEGGR
jgi:DNA-directed RNA polymerase specialized sigma24 family protein